MKKFMLGMAAVAALALIPGCGKKAAPATQAPTPGAMQHLQGAGPEKQVKEPQAGAVQAAGKTQAEAPAGTGKAGNLPKDAGAK